MSDSVQSDLRICPGCARELALSNFYEREKNQRWDSTCKDCRKNYRRSKYRAKNKVELSNAKRAKRIIELKNTTTNDLNINICESKNLNKNMDYTDLEKQYGLQLTHVEKNDSIKRFNDFVSILREEYGKQLGCKVYVTKD